MMVNRDHTWEVGQTVPLELGRKPLGELMHETWFILLAKPMKEKALVQYLKRAGCVDVWRPVNEVWVPQPRSNRKRLREVSVAPGYVFALMDRTPAWDVIRAQAENLARGVVSFRNGKPCPVSDSAMAKMEEIPERIEQAREEERRRYIEATRPPEPGEEVKLASGPLSGFTVCITEIDRGVAHFVLNGIKGSAKTDNVERLAK